MCKEIINKIKNESIEFVSLKFCDIHGSLQNFTIPSNQIDEKVFKEGVGFDGSSIRGWKGIEQSDMLVIPDPSTAWMDPFIDARTLSLFCDVHETHTHDLYERAPRTIVKKAQAYLESTNIADTAYFGPEAEFFIFDNIAYQSSEQSSFYTIDSEEAIWNTGNVEGPNQGYQIPFKGGYLPVPPSDKNLELRNIMVRTMLEAGISVECQHHEVATAGQSEIDIKYNDLLTISDQLCTYKYIVKNVAYQHGKTATFLPKPIFGDNGSGMHVHQSLWKKGKPLFAGDLYANLSQEALWYIGGLLKHAGALSALNNPTTNSYKRLIPGYEAPVNLAYSSRNRSAVCRIPAYSQSPDAIRIELRSPDPTANPYLAFSALLLAGLDGIQNKIDPGDPIDKNLYQLSGKEKDKLRTIPKDLDAALDALEKDHQFLIKEGVFSKDFIDNFISLKREEVNIVNQYPHPHEFSLYYDA